MRKIGPRYWEMTWPWLNILNKCKLKSARLWIHSELCLHIMFVTIVLQTFPFKNNICKRTGLANKTYRIYFKRRRILLKKNISLFFPKKKGGGLDLVCISLKIKRILNWNPKSICIYSRELSPNHPL